MKLPEFNIGDLVKYVGDIKNPYYASHHIILDIICLGYKEYGYNTTKGGVFSEKDFILVSKVSKDSMKKLANYIAKGDE